MQSVVTRGRLVRTGRNNVDDHTGRAGNERRLQAMLTPVVNPEEVITVLRRQPVATLPVARSMDGFGWWEGYGGCAANAVADVASREQ